jgi:hypothetical protein
MNAGGINLGEFPLGVIIEGKTTGKDVELDGQSIAGRATA